MKKILSFLFFSCLSLQAQQTNFVDVPVQRGQDFVRVPQTIVLQPIILTFPQRNIVYITNNFIDPNLGPFVGQSITSTNTKLSLGAFPTNQFFVSFYFDNPANLPVQWPTTNSAGLKINYTLASTNTQSGVMTFENVFGKIKATLLP